ncbi:nitroreductase family protein [Geosporobacter ferrireducens]|uniref:Nitroreductase n=1 Tax=Geosporobacter ferrireducens TaxID=1424294 RepID=A0A1D8GJZ1_9FIRM|nr:nitroreductase family protein [Geosporobacter ferrireducens]AOT71226.1 nitroreductase [Geosporobacter ferrireducens]MTI58043.1 nitroreductase [Geosporobacter ferrireducens]
MKPTGYYNIIFKRKSIRKYETTPIEENKLDEISFYLGTLKPMYEDIKTEMKIVPLKDIKSLRPIKAPHYVLIYSEVKDGYLENAGFLLQQVDLYLSANGMGSCWVGMAKPAKEMSTNKSLEFVIALAFGKPMEPLHRESLIEFKRKSLEDISNTSGMNELLEAARLAPSGINSQPWFFAGGESMIHAYCIKSNILKAILYEKINKIDMGIAICHIWLAAKHFGKDIQLICNKEAEDHAPKGYDYIVTVEVQ